MRRILFVHNRSHIDRAIADISSFFGIERRCASGSKASDLLAVIVMPSSYWPWLGPETQKLDPRIATPTQIPCLFLPESISVNGVWLLVTLSETELLTPTPRQEALSRALDVVRSKSSKDLSLVFPVFSETENKRVIVEELAFIRAAHPTLDVSTALIFDAQSNSWEFHC